MVGIPGTPFGMVIVEGIRRLFWLYDDDGHIIGRVGDGDYTNRRDDGYGGFILIFARFQPPLSDVADS